MPANFTESERNNLFEKFYEEGYILLKNFGYKKLKVSDIAKSVGIATGTFYNFFGSKDEFIIWLIKKRKDESIMNFLKLSNEYNSKISRKDFENYLYENLVHYNIYRILSQEDFEILNNKFGMLNERSKNIEKMAEYILNNIDSNKTSLDFKYFSEAYTMIIIGSSDIDKLNKKYVDVAIKQLIHSACDFIF